MMNSFLTVYVILFVGLFEGTHAQINCYACTGCAIPFNSDSIAVTKPNNCRFCEEMNEYSTTGAQTLSTKTCVTGVKTCTPILQSTTEKTMETKCCRGNFCNTGFLFKPANVTIGLLAVLTIWIAS
ncbi:hypothetical protein EG68_06517 [Paragonimus skrjabini miyazakii]|uniref:UPAR/Ly6 domain-containing protein n=1 Tax=Paragonimus skrjabini miyazakii TaxID=59628 RepID=A0A8S9YMS3_9TREM|nr:hypothetical protein EG68_06517 [Paragonimus skrjabini miyazakii]